MSRLISKGYYKTPDNNFVRCLADHSDGTILITNRGGWSSRYDPTRLILFPKKVTPSSPIWSISNWYDNFTNDLWSWLYQ
jgi:hypothetical protein